ncbi:MAG: FkbM family methyltransferase [Hymenobacteraceae bacterium]|nr:FkbM family methyltransferase [Hymenobacteraceae bacterium]
MARPLLLTSALWLRALAGQPLVVVDGGSRGRVFAPLDRVPADRLLVARFEPEPGAAVEVRATDVTFRQGLWRDESTQTLHVAREPSTSSIYPPDERLLTQFVDRIGWPPRQTVARVEIPCTTTDAAFQAAGLPAPDFIKLDIHSAEFEALEGAAGALRDSVVACLVEAWPAPLHRGQRTAAEVEVLLVKAGFLLFEHRERHAWRRKSAAGYSKPQITILESLYFRDVLGTPELATWPAARLLKAVALADLYGHIDYALQLLDAGRDAATLDAPTHAAWRDFLLRANPRSQVRTVLEKLLVKLTIAVREY